jgi:hypothetical protein
MIPAMIIVVFDIGFFGPVSFGTSIAFSAFGNSFNGAGGAGFSSGDGTVFTSVFTGSSIFTTGSVACFGSTTRGVSGTGGAGGADVSATGAATFTASAGAAGLVGAPQDSQNFTPGASAAPHFGQEGRASIFAPQDSQNFTPGATGLPHFWQVLGFSVMDTHSRVWLDFQY